MPEDLAEIVRGVQALCPHPFLPASLLAGRPPASQHEPHRLEDSRILLSLPLLGCQRSSVDGQDVLAEAAGSGRGAAGLALLVSFGSPFLHPVCRPCNPPVARTVALRTQDRISNRRLTTCFLLLLP